MHEPLITIFTLPFLHNPSLWSTRNSSSFGSRDSLWSTRDSLVDPFFVIDAQLDRCWSCYPHYLLFHCRGRRVTRWCWVASLRAHTLGAFSRWHRRAEVSSHCYISLSCPRTHRCAAVAVCSPESALVSRVGAQLGVLVRLAPE